MTVKKILIISVIVAILVCIGLSLPNPASEPTTTLEQTPSPTAASSSITIRVPATHSLHSTSTSPQAPDGPDSHWFYSQPLQLEADTVVTGFAVDIEGADDSILHHAYVGILNRPSTICTEHASMAGGTYELFSASRHTLEPFRIPQPYGIFLKAGEVLIVEFMAHPQAQPYGMHDADESLDPTLVVTLETDNTRTASVLFTRLRLDDSPCTDSIRHQAFAVPVSESGASFTKTSQDNEASSAFTFSDATTIVASGANFWPNKGGQNVEVFLDEEKVMQFTAEPGDEQYKWDIPFSNQSITIPAGTTLHIQSTYQNPFDTPILDASGMFGFYYTE